MRRIAVIFESSPFDRKGLFNAVHNRIVHLLATGECEIDAYCIHSWDTEFTRKVRHTPEIHEQVESVDVEGFTYKMLWYDFSLVDHALVEKCHLKSLFFSRHVRSWASLLKGYDCISAHSFAGGLVAQAASEKFGIPYYVSWHGSDVHTHPQRNSLVLRNTKEIMEGAACNFFVSESLKEASEKITSEARKEVLYNGVSEGFVRFPEPCRSELRRSNGLADEDKVVAFVGSIVAVKNVSVLQPLFHEIRLRYDGPLKFWIVGDGKLRGEVEPVMKSDASIDVTFWGNVPAEHMPSVMNCVDVMVLPSLNEGLPLVCAEAVRCGASVIGSDIGGIPEVVGKDLVVPFGTDFISDFADKVVQMLVSPVPQSVPSSLDWSVTALKELAFIKSL